MENSAAAEAKEIGVALAIVVGAYTQKSESEIVCSAKTAGYRVEAAIGFQLDGGLPLRPGSRKVDSSAANLGRKRSGGGGAEYRSKEESQ